MQTKVPKCVGFSSGKQMDKKALSAPQPIQIRLALTFQAWDINGSKTDSFNMDIHHKLIRDC